jgi:hypothetical protein
MRLKRHNANNFVQTPSASLGKEKKLERKSKRDGKGWRSLGKSENPAKSMGLPVFRAKNRALFHRRNFGLWQTHFSE